MDEGQAKLIAEQLGRLADQLNSRMAAIEESLRHHSELDGEKVRAIREDIASLRKVADDHEGRLRSADGVTTFKTWSGLASGGSSIMAIVAFIKSFLP